MAASVFDLAIALDVALHTPNEPLLAAIRIQWWADTLKKTSDQNVPLVARLQSHYQRYVNFSDPSPRYYWQVAGGLSL